MNAAKEDFNSKLDHLNSKVDRIKAQFKVKFAKFMVAIQSTRKKLIQEGDSSNSTIPPHQNTTHEASHMKQHEVIPPRTEQNHRVMSQ